MALRVSFIFRWAVSILSVVILFPSSGNAVQSESKMQVEKTDIGPSGLPLPRFASLKSNRVNVRVGPDQSKYAVAWSYRRQGLPVEIIQEYGNWRRIRDSDGDLGWVNQALLSGRRMVVTVPWQKDKNQLQSMRKKPAADAVLIAQVEPGVIGKIRQCNGEWCELEMGKSRGWLKQDQLWGVYPGEKIN